jgi:hypothetical protein
MMITRPYRLQDREATDSAVQRDEEAPTMAVDTFVAFVGVSDMGAEIERAMEHADTLETRQLKRSRSGDQCWRAVCVLPPR